MQPYPLPATSPPHVSGAELDRLLADWVARRTRPTQRFSLGPETPLNLINDPPHPTDKSDGPLFQGYLIGAEVVDRHVIAYFGFQDVRGGQYYVPFNAGNLGRAQDICSIAQDGTSLFPGGQAHVSLAWIPDCLRYLQLSAGHVLKFSMVSPAALPVPISGQDEGGVTLIDFNAQKRIAKTLLLWSYEVAQHRGYRDQPMPAGIATIVNRRVTRFVREAIPFAFQFARYGDAYTEPLATLPFTVGGHDATVSDMFTLAKGMYRVTYTATGSCAGLTARLRNFADGTFVTIATGTPAGGGGEPVTTSVSVAKVGRYYVSAGVPGCSWSFTFASP